MQTAYEYVCLQTEWQHSITILQNLQITAEQQWL